METVTKQELELHNESEDFEAIIKQYLIERSNGNTHTDDKNSETYSSIEDDDERITDDKDVVNNTEAAENETLSHLDTNADNIPNIDEIFDLIEDINQNKDTESENDGFKGTKNTFESEDEQQDTDMHVDEFLKTEQEVDDNIIKEIIPELFDLDELYDSCNFAELDNVHDCKALQNEQIFEHNQSFATSNDEIEASKNMSENNINELNKTIEIEVSVDNSVTVTEVDNSNSKDTTVSSNDDSDYCAGYNSSDFEFISENEAKNYGLFSNESRKKTVRSKKKTYKEAFDDSSDTEDEIPLKLISSRGVKLFENTDKKAKNIRNEVKHENYTPSNNSNANKDANNTKPWLKKETTPFENTDKSKAVKKIKIEQISAKPSTSNNVNENNAAFKTRSYYNALRVEYLAKERLAIRKGHVMPEGDDYFKLFDDILPRDMNFTDKAIRPLFPMNNIQFEGIGFDMNLVRHDLDEEIEYKDEAEATSRMILAKFPKENRKRLRRRPVIKF